jgi:predicted kinase
MSSAPARRVILVSGAPGAGKTSVAEPLAQALGFALLSKDPIKEALFDTLDGRPDDLVQSRKFGDAAIEVMLALAAQCPQVVLEANFHPHNPRERERIRNLGGKIVEVYCTCPPEEIARRYADRAASTRHHPAHALKSLSPELLAEYDGPIGIGTLITIDTTRPVSTEDLVRRIQSAWSE